MSLHVV